VIETAVAPSVNADTATGAELEMVVPLPSRPSKLLPQQLTAPVFNNAHVWELPAVIETAVADPSVNAATATGTKLEVVLPLPSSPLPLKPQQLTAPVFNNAHVWELLAVIETAVADTSVNAATATGTELSVVLPLPSRPLPPFRPQQLTAPVFNTAHVW